MVIVVQFHTLCNTVYVQTRPQNWRWHGWEIYGIINIFHSHLMCLKWKVSQRSAATWNYFYILQCLQYRIALIFHRAKCWPISQIGQLLCTIFWEILCLLSDRWLGWHGIYDNFSWNFLFQSKVCSTKLSCYTACHCLHHANTALTSYCEQSLTAHYYCIIITITFITVGLFFRMDFIFRNWHTYEKLNPNEKSSTVHVLYYTHTYCTIRK